MESKKSPKVELESKKSTFIWFGLVVALGICLGAFEWTTHIAPVEIIQGGSQDIDDVIIPITRMQENTPPPPEPKTIEILNIIDEGTPDDGSLIIETEITTTTKLPFKIAPIVMRKKEVDVDTVFINVQIMPEFPGGEQALLRFLANSIKYPAIAQETNSHGKVFVNFIIDKDGSVTNAKVLRELDPALDKEALRVVNSLPKWKPGIQQGNAVRVSYTIPISFVLE